MKKGPDFCQRSHQPEALQVSTNLEISMYYIFKRTVELSKIYVHEDSKKAFAVKFTETIITFRIF